MKPLIDFFTKQEQEFFYKTMNSKQKEYDKLQYKIKTNSYGMTSSCRSLMFDLSFKKILKGLDK